ncbi:MAG: ribonuclease III [Stagnimonas sp.]|nr:ribonuclease III [Stagnimonas sp.]
MTAAAPSPLETALGHRFADRALLQRALTHRSAGSPHYERLEFLGDGLLNFVIAEAIYGAWPKADEGDLSRWRASLVCEDSLARLGKALNLGDQLRLGSGELKSGGFRRESILADALEALLGAVYLDAGFEPARAVVLRQFQSLLDHPPEADSLKDSKTRLQEALQAVPRPLPEYAVLSEHGPPHRRMFQVCCRLPDSGEQTEAGGSSRKQAEQDAARLMIEKLKESAHA